MSEYPAPGTLLLWKFLCSPDQNGTIWWRWEVWTQAGQHVTTSSQQFETLSECQSDAKLNGYVMPERRKTPRDPSV
jgi:hypothetical protein